MVAQDSPSVAIQSSVGLAVQLVQAAAQLPPIETTAQGLRTALAGPTEKATSFWLQIFKR